MLRSLDLFSGMGGMALALRGIARPVGYCEIEPAARAVLDRSMARGDLPRAPVHPDVRALKGAPLRGKVDIVVAGSPCIGFSTAGKLEGFRNPQSGLFKHVVRLLKEARPDFVFLENVPGILGEMRGIARSFARLGFRLTWLVVPAYAVGCPQKRSRWYCLAYRPSNIGKRLAVGTWKWRDWSKEPVPRMSPKSTPESRARLKMLGNGVVPDAVRLAFLTAWTGLRIPVADLRVARAVRLREPEPRATASKPSTDDTLPKFGATIGADPSIRRLEKPRGFLPAPRLRIALDPRAYRPPSDYAVRGNMTTGVVSTAREIDYWGTPRASGGSAVARFLTHRCMHDLGTQLRFARDTPDSSRNGLPNPDWVEWLMGMPRGWTETTR